MAQPLTIGQKSDTVKIPDFLIREIINGIPYYYKGYREVLHHQKTLEDIMGSSGLQSYVIAKLVEFLILNIDRKSYQILYSELGLHISSNNNLSSDISIYRKVDLKKKLNNKYLEIPPKIAIEVDTKIEVSEQSAYEYINLKTQKLLDFGVEQVIWVFTESKKILVAKSGEDWLTKDWNKQIQILEKTLSIQELLIEEDLL